MTIRRRTFLQLATGAGRAASLHARAGLAGRPRRVCRRCACGGTGSHALAVRRRGRRFCCAHDGSGRPRVRLACT